MFTAKINEIEDLANYDGASLVCYHETANKFGLVPIGNITGKGYAGVKFRLDNSTPEGIPEGNFEMIANLPGLLKLGGYLVRNDHSRRKLSPTNHHFYETGGAAALDGSEGHYQWGWGVEFYYAFWIDQYYFHEGISTEPIPHAFNYKIPIASMSRGGGAALDRTNLILVSYCNRSTQFRGGNNDSSLDGTDFTQCGKPVVNVNADNLQRYAEKNGDRWGSSMFMMYTIVAAIERIYFHNRNIQAARNTNLTADGLAQGGLGTGPSNVSAQVGNQYATIDIDALADMGDALGVFSWTKGSLTVNNIPLFFGLLAPYQYIYHMQHGNMAVGNADKSMDIYAIEEWKGTPVPVSTTNGMVKIGTVPAHDTAEWCYTKNMNLQNLCMFPTELGATASTFYCDGFYHPAITSGLRGLRVLGNADHGSSAGSCALTADTGPADANVSIGASLCEAESDWSTKPVWVA